jgi:ubiquinone/menaquinone biosynthesis C-methylase UbiE
MIDAARQEARKNNVDVAFSVGSLTTLPYRQASFDVVLTNIVFLHLDLEEKRRAVSEIARLLKPGARYISAEFGPRARNVLERRLAKGEYTLYPSHLRATGLVITREELSPFPWRLQVFHRVAVKPLSNHG